MTQDSSWPEGLHRPRTIGDAEHLVLELHHRVIELEEQLRQDSTNSSKPSSTDSPYKKTKKSDDAQKKKKSSKKRGAQTGHPGHHRKKQPLREHDKTVAIDPESTCPHCHGEVVLTDAEPLAHQVFELPELDYFITEYQLNQGCCKACHSKVRASLPKGVPHHQMGPNLQAFVAYLFAKHHRSVTKTQALLFELFGLQFSIGALSESQGRTADALAEPHEELKKQVSANRVVHADETHHKRNNELRWLWGLFSQDTAYLHIDHSRGKNVVMRLLDEFEMYLVTDQYAAYNCVSNERRQYCWAHLKRVYEKMASYSGGGYTQKVGERLLLCSNLLFRTVHRWQQGELSHRLYRRRLERLKRGFSYWLERGAGVPAKRYRGHCKHLLKSVECCWTFMQHEQIPLTNNHAERGLRHAVIMRKINYGVRSHRGELFRARSLSIIETCKLRGISAYHTLRDYIRAHIAGEPMPQIL